MSSENNKRIAKNTGMLYIRMLLTMAVSLYTSRIVLNTLGVEDFGIYNVVGGVVAMFSFLNGAMASATQRFLSFEIGRKDSVQFKKVFSHSVTLHILIAITILFLAETLGLLFLDTKMNIPMERMEAARWVFQFSVLSFVVTVIQVPYNAAIIAHERMNVYAYISIIEVTLKLLIVFMLVWIGFDKLKLYAILIFCVTLLIAFIYRIYCKNKFEECHYHFSWDKSLFYSLLNFSGWSLFGNFAWITMGQGLNIMLNIFFGPIVNTAWGIAFQVNYAVNGFVVNIRMAINPQIVKSYAGGDKVYMRRLVFESAKYSFFLLLFLSLPVLLETKIILHFWLKIVPDYAIIFCRLVLINTLIQCFDASFGIVFQAIGKIKENQLLAGGTYLLILPIAYVLLKFGYPPQTVFYIQITATFFVAFVVKFVLLQILADITAIEYFKKLILPVIKVTVLAVILPILIKINISEGISRFLALGFSSSVGVILAVYFVGINKSTRLKFHYYITTKLQEIKNGK